MSNEQHRERFLKGYVPDAPERPFFEASFRILEALNPPISYHAGLACIRLLHLTDMIMANGYRFFDDPIAMGSIEDCARIVAVVFAEINEDPIWWKASYPVDGSAKEVSMAVQQLMAKLKELDFVAEVNGQPNI